MQNFSQEVRQIYNCQKSFEHPDAIKGNFPLKEGGGPTLIHHCISFKTGGSKFYFTVLGSILNCTNAFKHTHKSENVTFLYWIVKKQTIFRLLQEKSM